jgi:predicted amidohydrolase YtcJ
VVGIWDLEIADNAERWRRLAPGHDGLRVWFDVYSEQLERVAAEGLATGDLADDRGLVGMGMLKIIADGSLGTRTAATSRPYPDGGGFGVSSVGPAELISLVTRAAGAGIATTIHAIGDVAVTSALDAFASAGVPGRIEHTQLVAHTDLRRFARLDVEASVQPEHALDDRELVARNWEDQTAIAYPLRELAEAGASVLLGSDAPVSSLDPWVQLSAAVFRARADEEEPWRPEQRLDVRRALAAATAGGTADPAVIEPGSLADLALVAHDPLAATAAELRAMPVHATLLAGALTHVS